MKIREFQELCRKEWAERNGDVRTLWLLESSYRELRDTAQSEGAGTELDIYMDEDDARYQRNASFVLNVLVNPATMTVVKMHIARDMDVADIFYGDGHFETRFLDPARAAELGFPVPA